MKTPSLLTAVAFATALAGPAWAAGTAAPAAQASVPAQVQADPGEAVTFMVVHRCHALWPHYETLGGFVADGAKP